MSYSLTRPDNRGNVFGPLDPLFDRFFDRAFRNFFALGEPADDSLRRLAMDVTETDKGYVVHADLPGVDKDAVKISVDGSRVTISAETKADTEKKDDGGKVIYRERSSSQYYRAFELPAEIDAAGAEAKLENGVLTLTLPRKAQSEVKQIAVR